MKVKLKDICEISTGVYVKTERVGDVYYLQARDFNLYNELESDLKPEILSYNVNKKHYLKTGDVIVAAKGVNHFAFTYNHEVNPAVASSMFIVLRRFDKTKVNSGFVTWFVNHPKTQTYLDCSSKGAVFLLLIKVLLVIWRFICLHLKNRHLFYQRTNRK